MFHYQVSFIVYINVDQCSVADYLSSHGTRKIQTIYQQTLWLEGEGIDYKKEVYLVHSPQGTSLPDPCVLLKSTCVIITVHKYVQNPRLLTPLTCYCMFRRLVKMILSLSLSLIKQIDALAGNLQVTFWKIPTQFCYPMCLCKCNNLTMLVKNNCQKHTSTI